LLGLFFVLRHRRNGRSLAAILGLEQRTHKNVLAGQPLLGQALLEVIAQEGIDGFSICR
jgi:hypothetical protein